MIVDFRGTYHELWAQANFFFGIYICKNDMFEALGFDPEKDIDSFQFQDISIEGYQSYPAIKGDVAV